MRSISTLPQTNLSAIRLGFVPLVDAAPLIVAKELGIFKTEGLNVRLSREAGWATIRDKLAIGRELDASHGLAGLAFATNYGIGCIVNPCVSGYMINERRNAITISKQLFNAGVHSVKDLGNITRNQSPKPLRFAAVHPSSSHYFILHSLFASLEISSPEDVEIITIPPGLLPSALRSRHIDGFCAGEPWNSVAIAESGAYCLAISSELGLSYPEKILLATKDFASERNEEHLALIRSLAKAGALCDSPDHREEIAKILARPSYLDITPERVRASLCGEFIHGTGRTTPVTQMPFFSGEETNRPTNEKANLILSQLRFSGFLKGRCPSSPDTKDILSSELYDAALSNYLTTSKEIETKQT